MVKSLNFVAGIPNMVHKSAAWPRIGISFSFQYVTQSVSIIVSLSYIFFDGGVNQRREPTYRV